MKLQVCFVVVLAGLIASQEVEEFPEDFEEIKPTSACLMNINSDMPSVQPLFIRPGTTNFFHPSDRQGNFRLTVNEEMELICPSGFSSPSGVAGESIRIRCVSGTQFSFNGVTHNFRDFNCRNWPSSVARRRITTQRCYGQGIFVDIGFELGANFYHVFTSCHDTARERNFYTEYRLTPVSDGQQSNVARPSWRQADFYSGKNIDSLHTRVNQRNTIATILGSTDLANDIIHETGDVFLARGHMAAMTDFVSANEQRSTFFFINTAPQFQTFNAGNWYSAELSSRRLAADRNINLDVYTGTVGITRFRDVTGAPQQIFLDHVNNQVPTPELFYKILVNRADQSGVVLLGVNNPHLTLEEILRDHIICRDVSSQIGYVNWTPLNLRRGYSYACEVPDFLSRVPHIPGIIVTRLLV